MCYKTTVGDRRAQQSPLTARCLNHEVTNANRELSIPPLEAIDCIMRPSLNYVIEQAVDSREGLDHDDLHDATKVEEMLWSSAER